MIKIEAVNYLGLDLYPEQVRDRVRAVVEQLNNTHHTGVVSIRPGRMGQDLGAVVTVLEGRALPAIPDMIDDVLIGYRVSAPRYIRTFRDPTVRNSKSF